MVLGPHLPFSTLGAVFFLRRLGPTGISRPLYRVCRLTVSSSGDRLIGTDVEELGSDVFVCTSERTVGPTFLRPIS